MYVCAYVTQPKETSHLSTNWQCIEAVREFQLGIESKNANTVVAVDVYHYPANAKIRQS